MKNVCEVIGDEEVAKVHFGKWGDMTPRQVLADGVLKYAYGYSGGYVQLQILLAHKLIRKPKPGEYIASLTAKGRQYLRAAWPIETILASLTATPAPVAPEVARLVGAVRPVRGAVDRILRGQPVRNLDEALSALDAALAVLDVQPAAAPDVHPKRIRMRPETDAEHIARDMREGRFPAQSKRKMVPVQPAPATVAPEVAALVEAVREIMRHRPDYAPTAWDDLEEAFAATEARPNG